MPAVSTIIGAIGLAVAGGSAVMQYEQGKENAQQQEEAQNRALAEQQRQEKIRQQQLDLDSMRRKRASLREAMMARATAETVGTNQGAGSGSAIPGAYGGISGSSGGNILAVGQNAELGTQMFESNARLSSIYRDAAVASSRSSANMAIYGGMSSLGGMMVNNAQTLGKVGTWMGSKIA